MSDPAYQLYWEDVQQYPIFVADEAWHLPEKIFGYHKHHTLYVYQHEKLAAFYDNADSKVEAELGYVFYQSRENVNRVIGIKKKVAARSNELQRKYSDADPSALRDNELKETLVTILGAYSNGLGAHYLTQPQFFEKFEALDQHAFDDQLDLLARARFEYSKPSWVNMLNLSHTFFAEYGKRRGLKRRETEAMMYQEFLDDAVHKDDITMRLASYAIISNDHELQILAGEDAAPYVAFYDSYIARVKEEAGAHTAKGMIGNRGVVQAAAFVVSNEYYDSKNPPQGMERGMVLIVQNAWPELSAYYSKASAIVTNEGGITSHGVVVAREMKIPCVVGTKIATKIFKTGDMVEVDADKGIVSIVKAV